MVADPSPSWAQRTVRLDRENPYLALGHVLVFVRDQERSLRFFVDQLGFSLAFDVRYGGDGRFVAVAPPDGSAILSLVAPPPGSEFHGLIGQSRNVVFLTEDVAAKCRQWQERGVHFVRPLERPQWGGVFAMFEDVDGNTFSLLGFDDITREVEGQRRARAERLEAERRSTHELEIARQVQARLFPQLVPPLATLDYSGTCVQARQVGGDYYDVLALGGEHVGLVIGDVAGKGMAAALLMAYLQANLRSQCAIASRDIGRVLREVNRLFFENTPEAAYVTLFFGEYHDRTRRLRYVNCGHLPGLILRRDGRLERLESTATVLGLFAAWDSPIAECDLHPGDTLALYTDGITEASNDAGEELGEERLVSALRRHATERAEALQTAVLEEVRRFSPREQHDDRTLIIAQCQ